MAEREETRQGISIPNAIEMIQQIQSLPVVRDMSASQFEDFTKLSRDDWQKVWKDPVVVIPIPEFSQSGPKSPGPRFSWTCFWEHSLGIMF